MKIYSLMPQGVSFQLIEIEVSLMPGIPQVQITGLPDLLIRESLPRIRSAFRHQGFEWPKTKQIMINLKPTHLKKSSRGLELGIAAAILQKTKQLEFTENADAKLIFYGSLGLDGEVQTPDDLSILEELPPNSRLICGPLDEALLVEAWTATQLVELMAPTFAAPQSIQELLQEPNHPELFFSPAAARLLEVVGCGQHSLLLAGPSGSGKSTLIESLYHVLPPPELKAFLISRALAKQKGIQLKWRPFINPHHSLSALSMIGGGRPIQIGEISRAHGGLLVMDEYLEFQNGVQEALREPIEKGEIRLVRSNEALTLPAEFQLVATTNLCPCGDLVPERPNFCGKSLTRCHSHLHRLSGPMLDRFDLLAFSHTWTQEKSIPLEKVRRNVEAAFKFRLNRRQSVANHRLEQEELMEMLEPFTRKHLLPSTGSSMRRMRALLRVARTLADLDSKPLIERQHICEAQTLTLKSFEDLKKILS